MSYVYRKKVLKIAEELNKHNVSYETVRAALLNPLEAPVGYWISKNGKKRLIANMDTQHIKNCINMLEKDNNKLAATKLVELKEELENRQPPPKGFFLRGAL